jgi:hypothetical protein
MDGWRGQVRTGTDRSGSEGASSTDVWSRARYEPVEAEPEMLEGRDTATPERPARWMAAAALLVGVVLGQAAAAVSAGGEARTPGPDDRPQQTAAGTQDMVNDAVRFRQLLSERSVRLAIAEEGLLTFAGREASEAATSVEPVEGERPAAEVLER